MKDPKIKTPHKENPLVLQDAIIQAARFRYSHVEPNEFRRVWMNSEDFKDIEKTHEFSDKITSVCGIPIEVSRHIERGTFFFTENLLDKQTRDYLKEFKKITFDSHKLE